DRLREHPPGDRGVVVDLRGGHDTVDEAGVEEAHEIVLEGEVEARLPRVTLTAGATAQLVVDAPRLVALRAEDVEPTGLGDLVVLGLDGLLRLREGVVPGLLVLLRRLLRVEPALPQLGDGTELRVATEHDVGASSGHVRRDGDGALAAGLGHDRRLPLVVLGVEDLVLDALLAQLLREVLALLDARRPDEDRLPLLVTLDEV